ncbi:Xanthine/uracil/vitamin C permease protein [Dioscorea alata]|uniref:Xanthine/uracil/vitamin C permease protein n=1 Tax=Dioscorea alata TaxID=55571 RepID=A0ACB7UDB3_DIOAL|nr:Xanthine/uracil/vitamin C permease protein [Dioscorea alata]
MLGTTVIIPTVLVPQMGGGNDKKARVIQTLLSVAGLNTLLQTLFGTRLPVVIGGSYTFVVPTISIILAGRYNDIVDPHEKFKRIMRGTQGALIVASTLQIIIGFSGLWCNVTRFVVVLIYFQIGSLMLVFYSMFSRYLSPLSAAPLVALAGFGLYEFGFPGVAKCIEIGLPQLIFLIVFSQYIPHVI